MYIKGESTKYYIKYHDKNISDMQNYLLNKCKTLNKKWKKENVNDETLTKKGKFIIFRIVGLK